MVLRDDNISRSPAELGLKLLNVTASMSIILQHRKAMLSFDLMGPLAARKV